VADLDPKAQPETASPETAKPVRRSKQPIAVAVDYKPQGTNDLPRVSASGRGKVAERILKLAFASGVKVREDADLAQVLAAVEVDSVIPLEAFMAVAEILAYVYKANRTDLPPAVAGATP
jgi:flagellar biosynthesis protein